MNKRATALQRIVIEVATEGQVTAFAIRWYVENRISRENFNKACRHGMELFMARKLKEKELLYSCPSITLELPQGTEPCEP